MIINKNQLHHNMSRINNKTNHKKMTTMILCLIISIGFVGGCSFQSSDQSVLTQNVQSYKNQISTLESNLTAKTLEIKTLTDDMARIMGENEALKQAAKQTSTPEPSPIVTISTSLISDAITVVQLIKNGDMNTLQTHIHPTLGVRFSPYPYVDTSLDISFTSAQIANAMTSTTIYNWGAYDGTGEPISLTFANYYNQFIYGEDYANPNVIGNNTIIGIGNTIDNIATAYPTASFVDFHFNGFDPQFEGMDWSSLRLVFEQVSGVWYLVGIVHGQWTI